MTSAPDQRDAVVARLTDAGYQILAASSDRVSVQVEGQVGIGRVRAIEGVTSVERDRVLGPAGSRGRAREDGRSCAERLAR